MPTVNAGERESEGMRTLEPWKQAELAYEDAIAGSYDFHYYGSPIPRAHLKAFCKFVRRYSRRDDLVLDLGGGTGVVTQQLCAKGYRHVITADLSFGMLREAKKKVPTLTALVCDGEHLPFKDEAIQTIVCSSVLHHMPYPERVLGEVKRTLALYGVLIAQEPNQNHLMARPENYRVNSMSTAIMHYLYRIEGYRAVGEPPVHEYHRAFTRQELLSLFLRQFFVLEFRSRFAFSCLFTKIRSPLVSPMILALDRCLHRNEGSVFHIVCSKTDWGHRNIVKDYFKHLDRLRDDPDLRVPWWFMVCLLPLIVLGRLYELYERVRTRLQESG